MSIPVLMALNVFFLVFHTGLVLFNVFGWMHPRTRLANLVTLGLTLFSWVVMGVRNGIGYCICTDWHWQVREALGYQQGSNSYVQFLIETMTPWHPAATLVHNGSAAIFLFCLFMSVHLNLKDGTVSVPHLRFHS